MSMNRVPCECCGCQGDGCCCGSGGGCTGADCPDSFTCNVQFGAFELAATCYSSCTLSVPATSSTFVIQDEGILLPCNCQLCGQYLSGGIYTSGNTTCNYDSGTPCVSCPGCWQNSHDGGFCDDCSVCAMSCELWEIKHGLSYLRTTSPSGEYKYVVTAYLIHYGQYSTGSGITHFCTFDVVNDVPACPGNITSSDSRVTSTSSPGLLRTGWCYGAGVSCEFQGTIPIPTWSIL
jgi:hypothetical protein